MPRFQKYFSLHYVFFFVSLYALYLLNFIFILRSRSTIFQVNFSTVVMPIVELTALCMIGLASWRFRRGIFAVPACAMTAICAGAMIAIYISQGISAYLSGNYISIIALENSSESQFIAKPGIIFFICLSAAFWVWGVLKGIQVRKIDPVKSLGWRFAALLILVVLIFFGMLNARGKSNSFVSLDPDQSPGFSLIRNVRSLVNENLSVAASEVRIGQLMSGELGQQFKISDEFPFKKDKIYRNKFPFPKTSKWTASPNLIVIFTEGLSARFMESYGGIHPNLTPHLDKFATHSMQVTNYYNHTAPTFRGVKGILASGFPRLDGHERGGFNDEGSTHAAEKLLKLNYQTLQNILASKGYETSFISPQNEDDHFNEMLRAIGFATVYNYESIADLTGHPTTETSVGTDAAPDGLLADALIGYLKQKSGQSQPFFMATYNIGTHAFLESDGIIYQDGSNPALNRVHNFDLEIGRFLDYFENSEFSDNTILVFTTDHATFPEPPVVAALTAPDYKPIFVDKVPLLIYSKAYDLPKQFDAADRTSVDLTPSILQMLSIQFAPSSFLGTSLFEKPENGGLRISSVPLDFFRISDQGVEPADEIALPDANFDYAKGEIELYWYLERKNRIFPPK